MNRTVRLKAEQMARLIVGGVPMTQVAIKMGMSYDGVLRISKTPEFQEIMDDVQRQVLGNMDAKLQARTDLRNKMAEEMEDTAVPEAFQVLIENLRKKRDLKAALEVLDRDPKRQFAKGASAVNAQAQQPSLPRPTMEASVLSEAMKEAEVSHSILERSQNQKPAEA